MIGDSFRDEQLNIIRIEEWTSHSIYMSIHPENLLYTIMISWRRRQLSVTTRDNPSQLIVCGHVIVSMAEV